MNLTRPKRQNNFDFFGPPPYHTSTVLHSSVPFIFGENYEFRTNSLQSVILMMTCHLTPYTRGPVIINVILRIMVVICNRECNGRDPMYTA